jgi:hypothetical protein
MITKKTLPSAEVISALQAWARLHGRTWKAELRQAWETGNYRGFAAYPYLQQVRNSCGPSWLTRFKLPAEAPAPAAATSYSVITSASHPRGPGLRLGGVSLKRDGWRFIPAFQRAPSRKGWPNPDAALKGRVSDYTLVAVIRPEIQL